MRDSLDGPVTEEEYETMRGMYAWMDDPKQWAAFKWSLVKSAVLGVSVGGALIAIYEVIRAL